MYDTLDAYIEIFQAYLEKVFADHARSAEAQQALERLMQTMERLTLELEPHYQNVTGRNRLAKEDMYAIWQVDLFIDDIESSGLPPDDVFVIARGIELLSGLIGDLGL
ncbi:hypothetical protein [Roseibium sp. RKSG952]|uniref:hypothetical protein n=1 Tax=Roseibium sp. RKSG952 TaxID=2529384 RepID=UPI0012BBE568|nr:hypothetical protein [Roseibium sp. RKSG952]MTH99553.1 hypothetical protein [Roseibium sp. RKSG952]